MAVSPEFSLQGKLAIPGVSLCAMWDRSKCYFYGFFLRQEIPISSDVTTDPFYQRASEFDKGIVVVSTGYKKTGWFSLIYSAIRYFNK